MEEDKLTMILPVPVKEIRTSRDGRIDETSNCWMSKSVILILEQILLNVKPEGEDMKITAVPGYDPGEYPYSIKASDEYPITIKDLNPCNTKEGLYDELDLSYENCFVWIIADDFNESIILSLQNDGTLSRVPRDYYDEYYRWNFSDDRSVRRTRLFEALQKADGVRMVRKIFDRNEYCDRTWAFVITLRKDESTFMERVREIYRYVSARLLDSETIEEEEHCNVIRGVGYSIFLYIEGYGWHAQERGMFAGGMYKTELLHRIGLEGAIREMRRLRKRNGIKYRPMSSIMKTAMWKASDKKCREKYPDLSDRITAVIMEECRKIRDGGKHRCAI